MGNSSCGCSEILKEDTILDNLPNSTTNELIEFQIYSSRNLPNFILSASAKNNNIIINYSQTEIQGELWRIQKSSKESYVPRYCILTPKFFKYYKNQYSVNSNDIPLLEFPISKITKGKAFTRREEHFLEFSYSKGCSKSFLQQNDLNIIKPVSKNSKYPSFCSMSSSVLNLNPEKDLETLLFLINTRELWEKWLSVLITNLRSTVL